MSLLDSIAGIASPIGTIAGTVSGIKGLLSNDQKKLSQQQRELMDYQYQLNQKAANADLSRQSYLLSHAAIFDKIGKREAGINTAFDDSGSSATSVNSSGSVSPAGALPTQSQMDSQYMDMVNNSASTLGNLSLQRSQNQLVQEQAENMRQKNLTEMQRGVAELAEKRASAKDAETRAMYSRMIFEANERFIKQNAKNDAILKDNQAFISDLDSHYYAQFKVEELEDLKESVLHERASRKLTEKDVKYYNYRLRQIDATIDNLKASAADSRSHIGVNNSTVDSLDEGTKGKKLENKFNLESYSDRLLTIRKASIPENLYQKIQMWRKDGTFEKLDGLQQLGYSLYEAMQDVGIKPSDCVALLKILKSAK